jgi:hypothetical protein
MFSTITKVAGSLAKGTIKKARSYRDVKDYRYVAYLETAPISKSLTADDLRVLAVELNQVADKLDELNKQEASS